MMLPIADTPIQQRIALPPLREASWNPALDPALLPGPATSAALDRLHLPGALVVTTGQQPGLFTGPAYTIHKALSARALARFLERHWDRPVVPVFWVPGDDHDLLEIATVSWLDADGELVSASLPPRSPDAPMVPLWREPLGPGVLPLLDGFERSFASRGIGGATIEILRRYYRPEASVAAAFGATLSALLAPLGIVCLDSTHLAVKRIAAPLFLRALEFAAPLDTALSEKAALLAREGKDAGVPVGDGATLVFLDGPLGRDRLVAVDGGFRTRRERNALSLAELAAIAQSEPTRLSPNVLLRPVVEAALLPTVAYLAGPAELKYLELARPVYERLGIARQLPVPRWSGLLVEPRVTRALNKFGASLEELLAGGNAIENRVARASYPEGTEEAFGALQAAISAHYAPVVRLATAVDPTLERPAGSSRDRALADLQKLEKKLAQHARRRQRVELHQIALARASVLPGGKPQERVLSMTGLLARYGPELLEELAAHVEAWYERVLEAARATP